MKWLTIGLVVGALVSSSARVAKGIFSITAQVSRTTFSIADLRSEPLQLRVGQSWVISERVSNPSFLKGLDGWQTTGKVTLGTEVTTHQPLVRIGPLGQIANNSLTQKVDWTSPRPTHLVLEYRLFTQEQLIGFDQPCFRVLANDLLLREEFCTNLSDSLQVDDQLYSVGEWQTLVIDVRHLNDPEIELKMQAGNTGDTQQGSGVELKRISTWWTEIMPATQLTFQGADPVHYQLGSSSHLWRSGESFTLPSSQGTQLLFWSDLPPSEVYHLPIRIVDSSPPTMGEVGYYTNFDSSYSLVWSSPGENLVYEAKTATTWQEFYVRPWVELPTVPFQSADFQTWVEPISRSNAETETFHISGELKNTWLAIKTRNMAGKYSDTFDLVELK